MQEKDMVSDVLSSLKSSLTDYGRVIGECEDQELRQTIQQIRNQCEHYHYQMFKIAEQKNYYKPAQKASDHQIQQLRSEVTQGNTGNMGSTGGIFRNM